MSNSLDDQLQKVMSLSNQHGDKEVTLRRGERRKGERRRGERRRGERRRGGVGKGRKGGEEGKGGR